MADMTLGEFAEKATFYHGGVAGLKRGDIILPSTETGNRATPPHPVGWHIPHYVYVTPDFKTALYYAVVRAPHFPEGEVYIVKPDDPLYPDPNSAVRGRPEHAWMCPRARVVSRVRVKRKHLKLLRRAREKRLNDSKETPWWAPAGPNGYIPPGSE